MGWGIAQLGLGGVRGPFIQQAKEKLHFKMSLPCGFCVQYCTNQHSCKAAHHSREGAYKICTVPAMFIDAGQK